MLPDIEYVPLPSYWIPDSSTERRRSLNKDIIFSKLLHSYYYILILGAFTASLTWCEEPINTGLMIDRPVFGWCSIVLLAYISLFFDGPLICESSFSVDESLFVDGALTVLIEIKKISYCWLWGHWHIKVYLLMDHWQITVYFFMDHQRIKTSLSMDHLQFCLK